MRSTILCISILASVAGVRAEPLSVWIGMAGPPQGEEAGIYRATLDAETGSLSEPVLAAAIDAPGFLALHPDGNRLYSLCRLASGEGGVAAFEIANDSQSLKLLNTQPTGDGEACHLAVDPSARCLFTAQYGTASICAYPLEADGTIGSRSAIIRHTGSGPNQTRQEGPHPHWVGTDPSNQFLLVPDLGADQIVVYRTDLDAGTLAPHGRGRCPAGAGPRHMKFHPNGRFVYVANELQLSVSAFEYDSEKGTLRRIQTIATLPEELRQAPNSTSELRIHPSGRFLYVANRGNDSISAFEVDPESGHLKFIERASVHGNHPRNFNLDPTGKWLLAAGRDSNSISLLRIDAATGGLAYTGTTVRSPAPICIELGPAP